MVSGIRPRTEITKCRGVKKTKTKQIHFSYTYDFYTTKCILSFCQIHHSFTSITSINDRVGLLPFNSKINTLINIHTNFNRVLILVEKLFLSHQNKNNCLNYFPKFYQNYLNGTCTCQVKEFLTGCFISKGGQPLFFKISNWLTLKLHNFFVFHSN